MYLGILFVPLCGHSWNDKHGILRKKNRKSWKKEVNEKQSVVLQGMASPSEGHQAGSSHSRHQQWPWNSLSNLSVSNNESPTSEPLANSKHRAGTALFITSSSRLMTQCCYFSNWIGKKKLCWHAQENYIF